MKGFSPPPGSVCFVDTNIWLYSFRAAVLWSRSLSLALEVDDSGGSEKIDGCQQLPVDYDPFDFYIDKDYKFTGTIRRLLSMC